MAEPALPTAVLVHRTAFRTADPDCLATAHPAKFPDAVEAATGIRPPLPPRMADLFDREERFTRLPNDLDALKAHIKGILLEARTSRRTPTP